MAEGDNDPNDPPTPSPTEPPPLPPDMEQVKHDLQLQKTSADGFERLIQKLKALLFGGATAAVLALPVAATYAARPAPPPIAAPVAAPVAAPAPLAPRAPEPEEVKGENLSFGAEDQ